MKAMIMAAGLGTRFRPHSLHTPKAAFPFLNVPLMGYSLFALEKLGLSRLVINTHHLPNQVKETAQTLTQKHPYPVQFSHEAPEILDSGGGVALAKPYLFSDEDFFVVNADAVTLLGSEDLLSRLLERHQKEGALATLLTCPQEGLGSTFGALWTNHSGEVVKVGKSDADSVGLHPEHFTGFRIFSPRIFEYLPTSGPSRIFQDALLPAIAQGEKVLTLYDDKTLWFETGDEAHYLSSTQSCLSEIFKQTPQGQWLLKLLNRFDQCSPNETISETHKNAHLLTDASSLIDHGVELSGFVVVGKGCVVPDGCRLHNVVLAPGVKLNPGSHLTDVLKSSS